MVLGALAGRTRLALIGAVLAGLIAWLLIVLTSSGGGERASDAGEGFGFADNSFEQQGVPPEQSAALASAAGATAARFSVSWASVQCCGPDRFDWSSYDPVVAALEQRGMELLPTLIGTPGWARGPDCTSSLCPPAPEHVADFAAFAVAAVQRWHHPEVGKPLLGLQIWNEPNFESFWPTPGGPDPDAYADLFTVSARAIDRVDDDLPLLLAGLDGRSAVSEAPSYLSIGDFLGGFFAAVDPSLLDPQDTLAAHAYAPRFTEIMAETRAARDELAPGRRITVTETGASSEMPVEDDRRQAAEIDGVLAELAGSDDVAGVFVYTLIDPERGPSGAGLGVVRWRDEELVPKVAYCSIADFNGAPTPVGCPAP